MIVKSTSSKGNFSIQKDGEEIMELVYEKWFSSKAITQYKGEEIKIKPKNIWNSKFDIYKDGIDKGDIIFSWKGDMIIRLENESGVEESWLLKPKGIWKNGFELKDENEQVVLGITSKMNWSKLSYSYEIKSDESNKSVELTMYSCYAINLYMQMIMVLAAT